MSVVGTIRRYTLEDFANIANDGFKYSIESATHDIIHALAKEVGAPDYVRTPVFSSNRDKPRHQNRNRRRVQEISDEDWEGIRTFQSREKQEVSDNEKLIRSMRDMMNRVTRRENIVETIIDSLFEHTHKAIILNCTEELMSVFFNTLVSNPLNVSIYAKALSRVFSEDDMSFSTVAVVISEYLRKFIREWSDSFATIVEVNEEDDFDLFCDMNKQNDLRLSKSKFLAHLYKEYSSVDEGIEHVLSEIKVSVVRLVNHFKDLLLSNNMTYQADQVGSSIIELFSIGDLGEISMDSDDDETAMDIIDKVVYDGRKSYPSLSNKLLFRLMEKNTYS